MSGRVVERNREAELRVPSLRCGVRVVGKERCAGVFFADTFEGQKVQ
jgi:hypothetical protein